MANTTDPSARCMRLRAFLQQHDIKTSDIAEQVEPIFGKYLHRTRLHHLLYKNVYMENRLREKLLDLGFPEDTLPPARPVARFPGLEAKKEEQQATA